MDLVCALSIRRNSGLGLIASVEHEAAFCADITMVRNCGPGFADHATAVMSAFSV